MALRASVFSTFQKATFLSVGFFLISPHRLVCFAFYTFQFSFLYGTLLSPPVSPQLLCSDFVFNSSDYIHVLILPLYFPLKFIVSSACFLYSILFILPLPVSCFHRRSLFLPPPSLLFSSPSYCSSPSPHSCVNFPSEIHNADTPPQCLTWQCEPVRYQAKYTSHYSVTKPGKGRVLPSSLTIGGVSLTHGSSCSSRQTSISISYSY